MSNESNVADFTIISDIADIEIIARGTGIRDEASIQLTSCRIRTAELNWYEAHGIGKREMKRKRYVD